MIAQQQTDQHAQHSTAAPDAARTSDETYGLPEPVLLQARALAYGDADGLRALLNAYPGFATGIVSAASPNVGLSAVRAVTQTPGSHTGGNGRPIKPEEMSSFIEDPSDQHPVQPGEMSSFIEDPSEHTGGVPTAEKLSQPGGAGPNGGADKEPSTAQIARAKTYNQSHAQFVNQFNESTHKSCLTADGQLDPVKVWHWQIEHHVKHDGMVGPETAWAAATAAKVKTEDADKAKKDDEAKAKHDDGKGKGKVEDVDKAKHEEAKVKHDETKGKTEEPKVKKEEEKPRPDDGGPGSQARKIMATSGNADEAFKVLVSPDDAVLDAHLKDYGNIDQQHALLDGVITLGRDAIRVQRAFHAFWHVKVSSADAAKATAHGGDNGAPSPAVAARDWPIPTMQAIHKQLKLIPDQDTRSGVWNKLSLTNDPLLINRAAYGNGDFLVGSNASTGFASDGGYSVTLTASAAAKAMEIKVNEGPRFKAGDTLALNRKGANKDLVTINSVADNIYTLKSELKHAHTRGESLEPDDGSGKRSINWLDATVRHEIAHSLDGGGVDTKGFYNKGGWVLGSGDGGFDTWVTAMGGESAWAPNDGKKISEQDRTDIKRSIVGAVRNRSGSLFVSLAKVPDHPIMRYKDKAVPVITAAETCLALGDTFYNSPETLYAANGKRFTISWWYQRFQHHNEAVVSERVANYGLYAPTEFFAEAYTVFYEEAGKPGITDADYGRLIRNSDWREWLREHVHNRGHAPKGTGAAKPSENAPVAEAELGAQPGGAGTGRASGNPGM
jgi:hypothetical protein